MEPEDVRKDGHFPYPPLPHPEQAPGGQVFPDIQIKQFPRLQRFDVDFDLPDAFIPELPPVIFLQNRPKLGDVSRGEKLFFGKAKCSTCHPAPFYLDDKMHDLQVERFTKEPGDGPIKTFTLRGIKDSPPYLHDGRCLTLEDTVEFFNLILGLKLSEQEKKDLVAFMLAL